MSIAVISDIHSNLQALVAVLADIDEAGVDHVVCAGDIVGYGGNPNECCDLVSRRVRHAVYGNHERAALSNETAGMNPLAKKAAEWTGRSLSESSRDYLSKLSITAAEEVSGRRIAMYHGSVDSYTEYVFEEELSPQLLESSQADILILGHTHVPYAVRFARGLALNPGAVGQPRDGDPRASYAIVDPSHLGCKLRRIEYDIDGAQKAIIAARLPSLLAARLAEGR